MAHRGPDHSALEVLGPMVWGFRRKMIQGLDSVSNEPLHLDDLTLVCNGEIYNHRELKKAHPSWSLATHNDCEVILHLYKTYGIAETLKRLDGEFAFILHDGTSSQIFVARDHLGVRPLYWGEVCVESSVEGTKMDKRDHLSRVGFVMASELEGLTGLHLGRPFTLINPVQMEPRKLYCFADDLDGFCVQTYYHLPRPIEGKAPDLEILKELFYEEVAKRASTKNRDVPLAITLSGGLDSSLVASCAVDLLKKEGVDPSTIPTYCVGKKGSPDLAAAREVANFLGTDHQEIIIEDKDMLEVIDEAIRRTGSICRTTIRATCPHLLVAKAIAKDGKAIVVLSGEAADEIWGSYAYFAKAPDAKSFGIESRRLASELHRSDGDRADRSIASQGLELRCPFTGKAYMEYVMSLDPGCKMFSSHFDDRMTYDRTACEKKPMRQAFEGFLPPSVLGRRKNGMSDAVSSSSDSWVSALKSWIDSKVGDGEPPEGMSKESYYYATRFHAIFGSSFDDYSGFSSCLRKGKTLKTYSTPPSFKVFLEDNMDKFYEWMPKPEWCPGTTDPSGREGLTDLCLAD